MRTFLFSISLFLSALLLFSIQPMAAKTLLPVYGGTPAVWTICMLFFQMVLLISYAYVWCLSNVNKPNTWRLIHSILLLLSLIALPLQFQPWTLEDWPKASILLNLVTQLGLPLFLIGASAPLLQFAYSQTKEKKAGDPYFLYVASNLGSLIALLAYPWLIERFIGLKGQFAYWSLGYGIYLVLLLTVLYTNVYQPLKQVSTPKESTPWTELLTWIFLSFVPCSLMLGVTLYITTDVAATPLFWVIPLALYLLTFVIAFSTKPIISHDWAVRNSLFFLIFTIVSFIFGVGVIRAWMLILINLLSFFCLALLCHGELYQRRPKPQQLTLFYFCLALGGMLAGVFNGLIAPHVFNQVYEYPIAILLSLLILPIPKKSKGWLVPLVVLGVLILGYLLPDHHASFIYLSSFQLSAVLALIIIVVWQQSKISLFLAMSILLGFLFLPFLQKNNILLLDRSFYGVNKVEDRKGVHVFINQSTVHGIQWMEDKKPLNGFRAYYGGVKLIVESLENEFKTMRVTLVGLGTGTMLCQFRKEDLVNVIEIDRQVIDMAKNPKLFTYLQDCPPRVELMKSDGRKGIEKLASNSQDLITLDAFSSDAIPMHLMTLEAFKLYQTKLSPKGVVLVNISNRHLDLLPVLNAIGHELDQMVFYTRHKGDPKLGQFPSYWALLTTNEHLANQLMQAGSGWRFLTEDRQVLWTDDYSNIVPLLLR